MINIFIDKSTWIDYLQGWEIIDVAVRDKNIVYLGARKSIGYEDASHLANHDIPTKIIAIYLDEPSGLVNGSRLNIGGQELSGMAFPVIGVSRLPFSRPGGMVSAKNMDGDTWPIGGGNGPMEHISPGAWPHPYRLKCINGYTYSVGAGRSLYKRVAVGQWQSFRDGFPKVQSSNKLGFRDLDAFSDHDMYAVGGHGDVWHYDGTKWTQMGFPSNVQLGTVTCAGDGNVYISSEGGSLWVGNKSTWKRIYEGGSSVLWNDVLWFQDKLWLASDYNFAIWNGKELEPVMHDGKPVSIRGHMDAYDGLLVVASLEFAMAFDGQQWQTIVAPYLD
ncbi:hypothetical protein GCM10027277_23880 [Pseudoduganella ginsengisoli]|uniref:Exo-alpha-sialidase n=1 Tax=Pseudoduganella ginsengisoli TaxID=1462440 RepID=A0A6L6Q0E5_9BURK|nr:hypothetical protein [Pseudoduganella ginsengisoli]MTW02889.1 hypothetical protein [Pseudoduganella ginsengisoli]